MTDQPRNYSVALIPGDGVGVEVVAAARQLLNAAASSSEVYTITYTKILWDLTFYKETGSFMLLDFKTKLQKFHAVLFGAVGLPGMPHCIIGVSGILC